MPYVSEPQEVVLADTWEVFQAIAFDTGQLPSPGDPITVRFHITPTGGVVGELEAESELAWPGDQGGVAQRLVGVPGSGWLGVDANIEIAAEVGIDIFGLWSGTIDLWQEELTLFAETTFDPLALGAVPVGVELSGAGLFDPFEVGYSVFPGLDVNLQVDVYPAMDATLSGVKVSCASAEGTGDQLADDTWAQLPAPVGGSDRWDAEVTYTAAQTAGLAVVVEPSINLDTFLGGFQLLAFPIDVPLVSAAVDRVWPSVGVSHPLPVLGPLPASLDAGEMLVGGLVNVPLAVSNVGALPLEGTATIVGSDDFTVFPSEIFIAPGGTDGLMVSFAPVLVGERAVELEIASSDPAVPVIRIPIRGVGLALEEDGPVDGPPDDYGHVNGEELDRGCGCDTTPTTGTWWWLAGVVALVLRRR